MFFNTCYPCRYKIEESHARPGCSLRLLLGDERMHERQPAAALLARQLDEECLCGPLRVLSRAINNLYEEAFRPLGVTAAQYTLLVALARLAPDATASRLGRALHLDRSTLSRDLARMESNGWISRAFSHDRRSPRLALTPAGQSLLAALERAWVAAQGDAADLLGDSLAEQIKRAARAILQHADEP